MAVLGVVVRTGQANREGPVRMEVLHLETQALCIDVECNADGRARVDDGVGHELARRENRLVGQVVGAALLECLAHEPARQGHGVSLRRSFPGPRTEAARRGKAGAPCSVAAARS